MILIILWAKAMISILILTLNKNYFAGTGNANRERIKRSLLTFYAIILWKGMDIDYG